MRLPVSVVDDEDEEDKIQSTVCTNRCKHVSIVLSLNSIDILLDQHPCASESRLTASPQCLLTTPVDRSHGRRFDDVRRLQLGGTHGTCVKVRLLLSSMVRRLMHNPYNKCHAEHVGRLGFFLGSTSSCFARMSPWARRCLNVCLASSLFVFDPILTLFQEKCISRYAASPSTNLHVRRHLLEPFSQWRRVDGPSSWNILGANSYPYLHW